MKSPISKNIRLLSIAFLFLFLGFDGVQQYVTTFFVQAGLPAIGFKSLILVYLFFILGDPLSAIFVSKYGAKKSMILGGMSYSLFIFALTTKVILLVYIASILLGIGASLLWTGQTTFLTKMTTGKNRGKSAGFFGGILYLGSATGIIIIGFLITKFSYNLPFLFAITPTVISLFLLGKLKDLPPGKSKNHFLLLKRVIVSKTVWRFSLIWFATFFVNGLALGIIPLEIIKIMGIGYVGYLSSLFYIVPILVTFWAGKLSDTKGRKIILLLAFLISFIGVILLYFSHQAFTLISGIVLIALFFSMMYPLTLALAGDVATKSNLEYLTAFFWMIRNVGIVSALVLSTFIQTKIIYIISVAVLGATIVILTPLIVNNFSIIKRKISLEMNYK